MIHISEIHNWQRRKKFMQIYENAKISIKTAWKPFPRENLYRGNKSFINLLKVIRVLISLRPCYTDTCFKLSRPRSNLKKIWDKPNLSAYALLWSGSPQYGIIFSQSLINEDLHCVKCVQIRSFFWSVFSHIRTEYGEIRSISPYSVQMRENTDQKKLRIWTLFTQCYFWDRSWYF